MNHRIIVSSMNTKEATICHRSCLVYTVWSGVKVDRSDLKRNSEILFGVQIAAVHEYLTAIWFVKRQIFPQDLDE